MLNWTRSRQQSRFVSAFPSSPPLDARHPPRYSPPPLPPGWRHEPATTEGGPRMAAWRTWASMALILAATAPAGAQNFLLKETSQKGDCFRLELDMNLSGDMHIVKDNRPASLKLAATARHVFAQRILD